MLDRTIECLDPARAQPPIFIVAHPRGGTTHLRNLLAASGRFATVTLVQAALPWETRSLGPILKRFIDRTCPIRA